MDAKIIKKKKKKRKRHRRREDEKKNGGDGSKCVRESGDDWGSGDGEKPMYWVCNGIFAAV